MPLKRILLIAPDHPDLNWPIELEQVGGKHQVVALLGKVDQERITRATTGQRFDVIHVGSHGSDAGIQLSDDWLSKEQFGQIARHVRCELVFLNACNSARLAQYLIDLGLRTVMAWTIAVVDGDAIRTASYFYDELAADDDLRKAYNKVNPRDGALTFLAGQGYLEDVIRPLLEQLAQVGQQVGQLVNTVTTQGKALRYVVAAVVAAIVLALVLVVVGVVSAQDGGVGDPLAEDAATPTGQAVGADGTIPDGEMTATAEPPPGCDASGGQPKKCTPESGPPVGITDTPVPEQPTATFVPTDPPTVEPTLIVEPTATPEPPTATFTPVVVDTATAAPTATVEPPTATLEPTSTPRPTRKPEDTPTRFPTWTKTPVGGERPEPEVTQQTATPEPENTLTRVATATATRIVWPTVTSTSSAQVTPTVRPGPGGTPTKEFVPCY